VFWRSVRDNYQRSLDNNYLDMRRRGIATGEGAGDQVTVEIAKCRRGFAEMIVDFFSITAADHQRSPCGQLIEQAVSK
jgi:hypothetical protein